MENVSDAGIIGDNVYSSYFEGAFISDFGKFDSEYMERPSTKLVSRVRDRYHCETCSKYFIVQTAPGRRPGGPRQALRPLNNNVHHHLRNGSPIDMESEDESEDEPLEDHSDIDDDHSAEEEAMQEESSECHVKDMAIDPSCMHELDDQLLTSPVESFADICWAEAVSEHDPTSERYDEPTFYNAPIYPSRQEQEHHDFEDDFHDLDPMAADKEKQRWYQDDFEDEPLKTPMRFVSLDFFSISDRARTDTNTFQEHTPVKSLELEPYPYPARSQPPSRSEPSLAYWEPQFSNRNPNDTVHGFPSRPPKTSRWKKFDLVANARMRFASRLVRSSS